MSEVPLYYSPKDIRQRGAAVSYEAGSGGGRFLMSEAPL